MQPYKTLRHLATTTLLLALGTSLASAASDPRALLQEAESRHRTVTL